MDKRNNDFDFDFMPIGQAIKKASEGLFYIIYDLQALLFFKFIGGFLI